MMLKIRHIAVILAASAACAVLPGMAAAQHTSAHGASLSRPVVQHTWSPLQSRVQTNVQSQRYAQNKISYAQAKAIAMRRHPGAKYVGMQLNGNTYSVRLQTSGGRVIDVSVDAVTGRVR